MQHAAAEQKHGHVSDNDAVALAVQGRGAGLVYVCGDDAVEVAPADDEAHGDAAFVDAFGIVGGPDHGVGDAGVDAHGAEEGAGIADAGGAPEGNAGISLLFCGGSGFDGGFWREGGNAPGYEHGKAGHAEERGEDVAEASLTCSIADVFGLLAYVESIQSVRYELTADSNGHDSGSRVGRNGQELRSSGFIAERGDDRGEEKGEGVERDVSWKDAC